MAYRTILVELADDSGLEQRLQVGRSLADRFQAMLIGMHVTPPPFISGAYGEAGVYIGPDLIKAQRKENREIAERVQAIFRRLCGEGSNAVWQEAEGDRGNLLGEAARTTDLLIARHAKVGVTEAPDVLDQLVTVAGVPVLAMPSDFAGELGQTALVAWNGSREATRAVHDALPLLHDAKRVVLSAVGDEAATTLEAAAAMLRRHNLTVHAHKVDELDGNAGEVLLAHASAHAADLLIMGAYGHARLRELVFGGATRHILREAALPVLFSS
jgi:nucleotide-binding universal stress UspA family protein